MDKPELIDFATKLWREGAGVPPTRDIVQAAFRDLLRSARSLVLTDLAFKLIAFAVLTPSLTGLLYLIRSRASGQTIADVDILRFFVTTRAGVLAIVVGATLLLAISALEVASLLTVGMAASCGIELSARGALLFTATKAADVCRLTAHMAIRVLVVLVPFGLAIGAAYVSLLREHDINYYLSRRPPAFWAAGAILAVLVCALAWLVLRAIAWWAVALPLVVFERVSPRKALGESARRSTGRRGTILASLAIWGATALGVWAVGAWLPRAAGRALAPSASASLPALLAFVAGLGLVWGAILVAGGIASVALFSLTILGLYREVAAPETRPAFPAAIDRFRYLPWRVSGKLGVGAGAVAVLGAIGFAALMFLATRVNRPAVVIAHRGASAYAPENTLAAFRQAAEMGTDFVELDVQESSDGQVIVVHDSDLMKIGGSPMKIWEHGASELRSIDVGSRIGPQFSSERLPTLAEVLALCKGRCRVVVELKSYGHDERLEERVVAVVEAAGMAQDCIFMSLDHAMVRKLKTLRPSWRCGVLVAQAVGDVTSLGGDFLAVSARMATVRLVRRAHRAGQDVYVWTVNDPAWMLAALGRGVDGLITDKPDLARAVIARRAAMSDSERFLVALLVRLGARPGDLTDQ